MSPVQGSPPYMSPQQARIFEAQQLIEAISDEIHSPRSDEGKGSAAPKKLPPPGSHSRGGSVRACSMALAATAMGAGALGVPYAFSLTGIGLGLATLLFAALASSLSLQILMVAARYTNIKSYASVLELAVGSRLASVVLDSAVLLNGFGAVTCTLIFEGDFLPMVFASPPGLPGYSLSRVAAIVGIAVCVWPLVLPNDLRTLRYVSAAVPAVLLITVAIVLWKVPESYSARLMALEGRSLAPAFDEQSGGLVVWWNFDLQRWLGAVAIMVNAFYNQSNAVAAANQLEHPSIARIGRASTGGNFLVFALLGALGVGGYVSFGAATQGDFLLNYPQDDPLIWVCRLVLALTCYLVLPLALMPTAKSCTHVAFAAAGYQEASVGKLGHAISATIILAGCTAIALSIEDVAMALGVLGGLLASSLMFWFPAVIFWRILWNMLPKALRLPIIMTLLFFGVSSWASVGAKVI